ncbi:MAG: VacJ family lipoprotein [Pseudomonadota bacterium]
MTIDRMLGRAAAAMLLLGLGACASVDETASFAEQDPYENTNRAIHDFNIALDKNVLRPVSKGYDTVAVGPVKLMIGNGLDHLELPVDFFNYLMQGEGRLAGRTLGRFVLNTTLGAGGLLDPATEMGVAREQTDFGVTLGKWGVGSGPYLVLPLLGPSNPRDLGGFVVDRAFTPGTYTFLGPDALGYASMAGNVIDPVDERSANADLIDEVLYESPDSYVTLRSIYLQRRAAQISGGSGAEVPDIFDDEATE